MSGFFPNQRFEPTVERYDRTRSNTTSPNILPVKPLYKVSGIAPSGSASVSGTVYTIKPTRGTLSIVDKTTTDVVTKRYKELSLRGMIINNPFKSVSTVVEEQPGYCDVLSVRPSTKGIRYATHYYGGLLASDFYDKTTLAGYIPAEIGLSKSVSDLAVDQAWANADLTEFAGLVSAAEAKETFGLVRDLLLKILDILLNVKKFRLKELLGKVSPSDASGFYLQCRYGIRPLVGEMQDLMNAFDQGELSIRRTSRGYSAESKTEKVMDYKKKIDGNYNYLYGNISRSVSISARAGVLSSIHLKSFESQAAVQFGLAQSAAVIWEIIPFSFIADWIWNIGEWSKSLAPMCGVKPLSAWVTYETIRSASITFDRMDLFSLNLTQAEDIATSWNVLSPCTMAVSVVTKERIPHPRRSSLPSIDINLDFLKILDLTCIASQLRTFFNGGDNTVLPTGGMKLALKPSRKG